MADQTLFESITNITSMTCEDILAECERHGENEIHEIIAAYFVMMGAMMAVAHDTLNAKTPSNLFIPFAEAEIKKSYVKIFKKMQELTK